MPMLEIRPQNKVNVLCTLEESIATLVNQYAAFAQASGDAVVNKALEYAFSKDAEFQKYRAANPAPPVALRVKKPAVVSSSARRKAKSKAIAAD